MPTRAEKQTAFGDGCRMENGRWKWQAGLNKEEQGMKNKGKKIEVRFFETAEFHVTPMPAWIDDDDCGEARE